MADYIQVTGKTVEEAVTAATVQLGVTSEKMEYEVIDKGSTGLFGIGSKPAIIKARKLMDFMDYGREFLETMMAQMGIAATITMDYDAENKEVNINIEGEEMSIVIGKRGQTLDSVQYLVSLVMNKHSEEYIRVKVDTENYRERRKETLENLAKNISYKVKSTQRNVSLEPMNPYERRIIHSALQDDKYVYTKSEGEEPYRHVVVMLKKEARGGRNFDRRGGYGSRYGRSNYGGYRDSYRDSYKRSYDEGDKDDTQTADAAESTEE